jgi:site-specific DNA-methyltransferase (adenine-specific)
MLNITNEDNMELMARYPDKYFDLAIVDPPYGIGIETSGTHFKKNKAKGWDNETPTKEYFNELFRISKNQIIWGGNYFLDKIGNCKCFIIWDKQIAEDMSFAMCEMAWT